MNILPWRRPWSCGVSGRHRNFQSQRPYSGVNPLLLELHNLKHGMTSNQFATFRQWESMGCCVKKRPAHVPPGLWGCTVVFCKPLKKTVVDRTTGEERGRAATSILRSFTVFSSDQVTGEAVEKLHETPTPSPDQRQFVSGSRGTDRRHTSENRHRRQGLLRTALTGRLMAEPQKRRLHHASRAKPIRFPGSISGNLPARTVSLGRSAGRVGSSPARVQHGRTRR